MNARLSYDSFDEPHNKEFGPLGGTTLPFRTRYQLTSEPWFPTISMSGYQTMFAQGFRESDQRAYVAMTTVSRTMGNHLVKAGGEFRLYRQLRLDQGNLNGTFAFDARFSRRNPLAADATSGNAFADFLLGYPSQNGNTGSNVTIGAQSDQRYPDYIAYVQDDWKISPRATLNIGVRYDYQRPVTEAQDRMTVGYDPDTPNPFQLPPGTINPATGLPVGTLRGGLLYAGVAGNRRTPYKPDATDIQPRVGVAYKVRDRIAARANYGRSYLGLSACCGTIQQDGFSQTTNVVIAGPQIGLPGATLDAPFPGGQFLQPVGNSHGLATTNGQTFSFRNPDFKIPRADIWMAGVNVELPGNIGLDVGYVGNKISGLPVTRNINLEPKSEHDKAIARLGGNPTYLSTQLPNPFAALLPGTTLNTPTISRLQLLRPNPLFININQDFNNIGSSTYRALEMAMNKRLSRDVAALVTYTWSRRRQATDLLNAWDAVPFEDIDSNDRPHRLTIIALWGLPFGPGKAVGGNTSGLVARLIEGWQYNVIGELSSGTPFDMTGNAVPLQDHFSIGSEQSLSRWFDNSTRTNPRPDGTYAWDVLGANDYRVSRLRFPDVRRDSKPQWSMSLFKNIKMGDARTLQIRGEVFNVFNARIYDQPISRDPTSPNFGVVSNSQINFPRTGQIGLRLTF